MMIQTAGARKPGWLKVSLPGGEKFRKISGLLRTSGLHTVCQEARCPNLGGCWNSGTATFMILGDVCTRACRYCNVKYGTPLPVDEEEPEKVARAVKEMGLTYAVITSVTRDDLTDGGAGAFARTMDAVRKENPGCRIEVLIPDYSGGNLEVVVRGRPDVLNHNIETVERIFHSARPCGSYHRSLGLLREAKEMDPDIVTKSGMMIGLGEKMDEIIKTMKDLRESSCDLLTIGQYLQPSRRHIPVMRYYTPGEFKKLKKIGEEIGFIHVESGPLVRSSYMAGECAPAR